MSPIDGDITINQIHIMKTIAILALAGAALVASCQQQQVQPTTEVTPPPAINTTKK